MRDRSFPKPSERRSFGRFLVVGSLGFAADSTLTLFLTQPIALPSWLARIPAFLAASYLTYRLNRRWTFKAEAYARGWPAYVLATGIGSLLNYAVFTSWTAAFGDGAAMIVAGVALGSLVGLAFNYLASSRVIFRSRAVSRDT